MQFRNLSSHKKPVRGYADTLSRKSCTKSWRIFYIILGFRRSTAILSPLCAKLWLCYHLEPDSWSTEVIRLVEKEDSDKKSLLEMNEFPNVRPSWQDTSIYCFTEKHYWTFCDSLNIRNDVLYKKWVSDDERNITWQLIVTKSWIQNLLRKLYNSWPRNNLEIMKILQKVHA